MADYGTHKDLSPPSGSSSSDRIPSAAASAPPKPLQARKPRGRPPGSKNKPKPPIVITREASDGSTMRPVVLEIAAGSDVVESIVQFVRRRRVGITLLSASGSVTNVLLRHGGSNTPLVSLHGSFSLLSLYGSVLASAEAAPSSQGAKPSIGMCIAGAQGQVFGGIIGGKVTAVTLVIVVAATFNNPSFYKLPLPDHHDDHHGRNQESKPCTEPGQLPAYNSGHVANPTPINCQLAPAGWAHTSRSPY